MRYLLAGDVGGTHTRLGLFAADASDPTRAAPRTVTSATFASGAHETLTAVVSDFLGDHVGQIAGACLAVAGPVRDGQVKATNLPWSVAADPLSAWLGAPVDLLNDVAAAAVGVAALRADELVCLSAGAPPATPATRLVLSAGTGLGAAFLVPIDGRWVPLATEAGHVEFAPRGELQIELLRATSARLKGRVSVERLASGSGLSAIYQFLRDRDGGREHPKVAAAVAQDPWTAGAVIGAHPDDPLCARTLTLFVEILGAAAGDLVLSGLALGGVYLGGGVPPKLLDQLRAGPFLAAFGAKGRHAPLVRDTPVHVITNPHAGFYGAALRAREIAA